jgi:hypothetical protein
MSRAATTRPAEAAPRTGPEDYLGQSELPLASLLFVLPLIVLYEVGTRHFVANERIIAFNLMQDFFNLFGASGKYLPALAVVGILLTWHIARNDPWRVRPGTLLGMGLESAALGLPLIAMSVLSALYLPLMPTSQEDWRGLFVLSLGAGIYEELVFRLIAFTLLHLILIDLINLPRFAGLLLMVLISAVLFAVYHYLGSETFEWRSFLFRTSAGVYFGAVFLLRGFGITAGAHAAYDLTVVSLMTWGAPF